MKMLLSKTQKFEDKYFYKLILNSSYVDTSDPVDPRESKIPKKKVKSVKQGQKITKMDFTKDDFL